MTLKRIVGILIGAIVVVGIAIIAVIFLPRLDIGGLQPKEVEVTRVVTETVEVEKEVTRIVVVTATPDPAATQLADAYAKSTASVAQANAEATMVSVKSTEQAQFERAAQTATSAVATTQATPIRGTSQAQSTVTILTVTPGPSPNPNPTVVTACVIDDNSGVSSDHRDKIVSALNEIEGVDAVGFAYYNDVFKNRTCNIIVGDYTLDQGENGPVAIAAYRLNHLGSEVFVIGYAMGGWNDLHLKSGLIQSFVMKPNIGEIVKGVKNFLDE